MKKVDVPENQQPKKQRKEKQEETRSSIERRTITSLIRKDLKKKKNKKPREGGYSYLVLIIPLSISSFGPFPLEKRETRFAAQGRSKAPEHAVCYL